jgi:hypothetical protein
MKPIIEQYVSFLRSAMTLNGVVVTPVREKQAVELARQLNILLTPRPIGPAVAIPPEERRKLLIRYFGIIFDEWLDDGEEEVMRCLLAWTADGTFHPTDDFEFGRAVRAIRYSRCRYGRTDDMNTQFADWAMNRPESIPWIDVDDEVVLERLAEEDKRLALEAK